MQAYPTPVFGFVYLAGSASHQVAKPAFPAVFQSPPSCTTVSPPKPPGQTWPPGVGECSTYMLLPGQYFSSGAAAQSGFTDTDIYKGSSCQRRQAASPCLAARSESVPCRTRFAGGRWFRRCGTEGSLWRSCAHPEHWCGPPAQRRHKHEANAGVWRGEPGQTSASHRAVFPLRNTSDLSDVFESEGNEV